MKTDAAPFGCAVMMNIEWSAEAVIQYQRRILSAPFASGLEAAIVTAG